MKAILMTATGGPEVLKLRDVPKPAIKSDTEMLVRIKAAGLNPVDAKQRRRGTWHPAELPQILDLDGAGIVEETGRGVTRFSVGDEVYYAYGGVGISPGNYAEYNVIDERCAAAKPKGVSFTEAAALPASLITSWESLFDRARLAPGRTVLIHAGAGGIGHVAVQLAKVKGMRVAATVSDAEKQALVKKLGAEKVIDYREEDFVRESLDWTEGRGVDAAVDLVGGETFFRTFGAVRLYGTLVALLRPEVVHGDWTEARLRNLDISCELMLSPMYYHNMEEQLRQTRILEECADMVDAGHIRPVVSRSFSLDRAPEAHNALEEGHTVGKIVLTV